MTPQIVIRDENNVQVGITFPKRAKQLVNRQRAKWLDEAHTEILLIPTEEGGMEMNPYITDFVNELFKDTLLKSGVDDIKSESIANLNEKYEALLNEGVDKDQALERVIRDADSLKSVIKSLTREKSIVKDAYRDEASVVLRSSPFEIIKKSKKRTRQLHIAFSAVLWTGAAIMYFGLSVLLGHTELTLNPFKLSWTWLVFVFAALIECFTEIYFCRKELDVLNENIDLRQINPSNTGDMDLRGYQKKLKLKIKLMYSAVIWIPLVIIYFISGYMAGLWIVGLTVFIFGVFIELLRNFIKKLKEKED